MLQMILRCGSIHLLGNYHVMRIIEQLLVCQVQFKTNYFYKLSFFSTEICF